MSLSWETFKSALGNYWSTCYIMYIDDEGSEIPIESDGEFQEALRLAKLNKNRLKLIFYDKSTPNSHKMFMTFPETVRIFTPSENNAELPKESDVNPSSGKLSEKKEKLCNLNEKENICCCNRDVPPEWFTHYMKKFRKALLQEVRSNILEIVENSTEKEQKKLCTNPVDLFGDKNETSATTQIKKKKKVSEKDGEQRDQKMLKKLEKLQSTKFERLEKLDNKVKQLLEEKKKLLDRKRQSKLKLEKICSCTSEKRNSRKKSASFDGDGNNNIYLDLTPGGEFTLTLKVKNDGKVPWSSPLLECFDVTRLHLNQVNINLPQLLPNESCFATIKGKANKVAGWQYFKCRVLEDQKPISTELTCWARVDCFEPSEKFCNVSVNKKGMVVDVVQPVEPTEKLIDIDVITSSKKKIEENIMEIEKRLQFMDLLRPTTSGETKNTPGKTKNVSNKNPKFETENCDLLQNSEEKEKNWTKRLEEEEVLFGVDCLRLESENNEASEVKANPKPDENQHVESHEKNKKNCELESSSDSELSLIFMSDDGEDDDDDDDDEEEENFIVVPLPSKSPSPAESVHEDEKSGNVDSEEKPATSQENHEPTVVIGQPSKSITIKIHRNRPQINIENSMSNNSTPNQSSPARSRRSPFGEEIPKSKPKKMKSKSTEYHFTTDNLTQPTFTLIPNGFQTERPSKFTFTGEKKEKDGVFEFTFSTEKPEKTQKDDLKGKTIPKTDASGKVIYAVNSVGRCVPVGDFFENGEQSKNAKEENPEPDDKGNQNRQEKPKKEDRSNEVPSVNILPNVLVNGASNVASLAFNTAKSVINNLQSAFVTEGKTELGKPAWEARKKVSMENMFWLYEMGFRDLQLNRNLLLLHDNNMAKVIEDLVDMHERPSGLPRNATLGGRRKFL